jgi:hypothetical protein
MILTKMLAEQGQTPTLATIRKQDIVFRKTASRPVGDFFSFSSGGGFGRLAEAVINSAKIKTKGMRDKDIVQAMSISGGFVVARVTGT